MLKTTKKIKSHDSYWKNENLILKNIKDSFLQLSEKRTGCDLITVEEASCIKWLETTEEGHNKNQQQSSIQ